MSGKMNPIPMDDSDDIISIFKSFIQNNVALPVAAMNTLVTKIKKSKASTWMELEQELRSSIALLKNCNVSDLGGRTKISLGSGCDLFMKYVTRTFNLENMEFKRCKDEILRRGERFANMSLSARNHIAEVGHSFIQDGNTILIHGISRVAAAIILKAAEMNTYFNLIVTEGRPNHVSQSDIEVFENAGIPTKIIHDSAIGVVMEEVDLILVGAEGVMENGGIINKIGTYQLALVANALNKPFYVAVESYKFARMYPLTQRDTLQQAKNPFSAIPTLGKLPSSQQSQLASIQATTQASQSIINELDMLRVDFTPAKLITLLFTDLGVLTPAAVSDELIKLYQ